MALAKLLNELVSKPEPLTTGTATGVDVAVFVLGVAAVVGAVELVLKAALGDGTGAGAGAVPATVGVVGVATVVAAAGVTTVGGILPVLKND